MKICKECKYWDSDILTRPHGYCGNPKLDSEEDDGLFLSYWNCEGDAVFLTGPMFGCIHWTAKESK